MEQKKIKLVVAEGHTLGYILPELPNHLQILQSSILRGAPTHYPSGVDSVMLPKNNRLATPKDFDDFRVYFGSFSNKDQYEWNEAN
jgi:hypothetical protein